MAAIGRINWRENEPSQSRWRENEPSQSPNGDSRPPSVANATSPSGRRESFKGRAKNVAGKPLPLTLGEVATPKGVDGEGKAAGGNGKLALSVA